MAIKIPSRHIYETPKNNKVKDNLIDHIIINARTAYKVNAQQEVYSGNITSFSDLGVVEGADKVEGNLGKYFVYGDGNTSIFASPNQPLNYSSFAYTSAGYVWQKKYQFSITISKNNSDVYIKNIKDIDIKFVGNKTVTTVTGGIRRFKYLYDDTRILPSDRIVFEEIVAGSQTQTTVVEDTNVEYDIEENIFVNETFTETLSGTGQDVSSTTNIQRINPIEKNYTVTENSDNFVITFTIIGSIQFATVKGHAEIGTVNVNNTFDIPVTLVRTTLEPTKFVISVLGEVEKLNLTESVVNVPSSSGNKPFSVDSNELLQTNNLYNSASAIQTLFANTYNHYKNGKETAVVLCDIADYFDGNELIISPKHGTSPCSVPINISYGQIYTPTVNNITFSIDQAQSRDISIYFSYTFQPSGIGYRIAIIKKGATSVTIDCGHPLPSVTSTSVNFINHMTFQQYDEVIPMVFGADGRDYPMSKDANGNAKVFVVLHTRIFYDGAVWQELTLQEK